MSADRFLEVFATAALQAGAVARRFQGGVQNIPKPGNTPEAQALTAADLACQDILLLSLRTSFPEAAVDAEEEVEAVAERFPPEEEGRPLVVLDPIDGTLNYLDGSKDYAVMAGWCEAGKYEASVVAFPSLGRLLMARAGEGAWELDHGNRVPARVEGSPMVVAVTRGVPESLGAALGAEGFEVVRTRCSAIDATGPVLGRASASLSVGRPGRRRSIGYLITQEAGGVVLVEGEDWGRRDPRALAMQGGLTLAAADRAVADRVLSCIESLAAS